MEHLDKIDKQLLKWAYDRDFRPSPLIRTLTFMGDGPFWMGIMFLAALTGQMLHSTPFSRLSILLMLGLAIGNLLFTPCKVHVNRRRPYANGELQRELDMEIINRDPGHGSKELESFPSGHALWTTLCVSLICSRFGPVAVLLSGWMIPAMLFLRPYQGVHYPSDVCAGLILGGVTALITLAVAPGLLGFLTGLEEHAAYAYGYWAFVTWFLVVGFKSWLKRV